MYGQNRIKVSQQINVLTLLKRKVVTAIRELGVHYKGTTHEDLGGKGKFVPLNANQTRGDLMPVEALCTLLISANLLQPTSTQRGKY